MAETKFQDPFSQEIWEITYKDHNDNDINDTLRRIAKAIASVEMTDELKILWERRFYDLLSNFKGVPGGRIISNAGTEWAGTTLINCFVGPRVKYDVDSLEGIYSHLLSQSQTLKSEGGWGENFSYIRPRGSFINGIGVETPGSVKYMELFDKTSEIITAGSGKKSTNKKAKGKIRKGAMMGVIDVWHPDVIEFITAKQQSGRLTKFNVSVNCTDEFMSRITKITELEKIIFEMTRGECSMSELSELENKVLELDKWELIFPITTFEKYKEEWNGDIKSWLAKGYPVKIHNTISAKWLWNLIMESTYNRAEPGVLFLDRANYFNPLNYAETIFSTNPCITGDTVVAVADGRNNVSIRKLAEEGKDVPVFCYDDKNNVVVRTMRNPRITGYNSDIYEVIFDDGTSIKTTANHKLKLLNGEYKQVSDLTVGDSIKTMQKYHASWNDIYPKLNSRSTDYMWVNSGKQTKAEHTLIAEFATSNKILEGYVVHHIDFNSLNNNPCNLKVMTKEDHDYYHSKLREGDNNPMRKAKLNWTKEEWLEYKGVSSPSYSTVGELNSRYNGITNEEIYKHALILTKNLKRRFSKKEWAEYSIENKLTQQFSVWRSKHLNGGVKGMSLKAATELGYNQDFISLDTRLQRRYLELLDQGYEVELEDNQLMVTKICEECHIEFKTPHYHREVALCSHECNSEYTRKRMIKNSPIYIDLSRKEIQKLKEKRKEAQSVVYNDLKFKYNRPILMKEWVEECRNRNLPYRIGPNSPFRNMEDLREYAENQNHRVVEVRYIGKEDVYNGTVDEFHNFFIGGFESLTKNNKKKWTYVNNLQCGEQTLSPGNICCLGTINLTQFVKPDGSGFDLHHVKKYVGYMVRFLDNVNSYSSAPLPEYLESMQKKRRIGLGIMGWGSSLFMMRTRFASPEAAKIREELMCTIARTAYETSIDLAVEKGMFEYCVPRWHAETPFINQLGLSQEYMSKLRDSGIRNASLLSQQPNGNSSILANVVSGGIEPIFMPEYTRTVIVSVAPEEIVNVTPKWYEGVWEETELFKFDKEGDEEILKGVFDGITYKIDKNRGLTKEVGCEDYGVRFLKQKGEWDANANWAVTTTNLTVDDHVSDLEGFARWTDSACSKTCNIPHDYPYENFKDLYLKVYNTGFIKGFTTYRSGTMTAVLSAKEEKHADPVDEEIILDTVKLPESAPASMKTLKVEGRKWYLTVVWNEQQTRPFALFVHTNHHEKNVTTSDAVEKLTDLARRKGIPEHYVEDVIGKISQSDNASKIARMISLNLRHGVLIRNIVAVLDGLEDVYIGSFLFQIKKYLSSFIKDGEQVQGETCLECGSTNVIYEEGCKKCVNCGSGKCS